MLPRPAQAKVRGSLWHLPPEREWESGQLGAALADLKECLSKLSRRTRNHRVAFHESGSSIEAFTFGARLLKRANHSVLVDELEITARVNVSRFVDTSSSPICCWKTVYQNRSERYEEVPEVWPVRIKQIMRWAKGHNQAMRVDQQARMNLRLVPQHGGTVAGVRLSALREIDGWNENSLTEDTDLTYRLLLNGWKTVYQNRSERYEEVPEVWPVRIKQIMRWAKGHNQAMRTRTANRFATPTDNG